MTKEGREEGENPDRVYLGVIDDEEKKANAATKKRKGKGKGKGKRSSGKGGGDEKPTSPPANQDTPAQEEAKGVEETAEEVGSGGKPRRKRRAKGQTPDHHQESQLHRTKKRRDILKRSLSRS